MGRHSVPRPASLLASLWLGVTPFLLAGLFPLEEGVSDRWCWSGAWTFPVGDPFDYTRSGPEEDPPYRANRVLLGDGGARHAGADLSNRRAGGVVRAAANGLVVSAASAGRYGEHVVLAHRLGDGSTVFTVYAHLVAGSATVQPGDPVAVGDPLGRVGDTGRATSPHLHFEVRTAARPEQRWERAPVRDPIEFVRSRLPGARSDSTWARPYLLWAECAGMLSRPAGDGPFTRADWWRMLASVLRRGEVRLDAPPDSLRAALVRCGLEVRGAPGATPSWAELARDLRRAGERGLRLPEAPIDPARRAEDGRRMLGLESPARELQTLGRLGPEPGIAAVCLVLADLAWTPSGPPTAGSHPPR